MEKADVFVKDIQPEAIVRCGLLLFLNAGLDVNALTVFVTISDTIVSFSTFLTLLASSPSCFPFDKNCRSFP